MNDDHHPVPEFPVPEMYVSLCDATEMSPRSLAVAERGVLDTIFGVRVVLEGVTGDEIAGMDWLVGDGDAVFQVVNVAVHPDHRSRGLGACVMDVLVDHLDREAPPSALVNLLADMDDHCERWGFELTTSTSKGMFLRVSEGGVRGHSEN